MKKKALILLCLALVFTVFFSACKGSEGATQDEASTVSTPSSVQTSTEATAQTTSEAETSKSQANTQNENTQSANAKPADREEKAKTATVNVGGKDYTVNVGDTVVYTCNLKTPEPIENIQAALSYDDSVLSLRKSTSKKMFPILSGAIYNTGLSGSVLFNASEPMEGFDFTGTGVLIKLSFNVAKEGYTSIATAVEYMDELGGEPYIESYKIVGNITLTETLS